jgi:outer membrane protein TolC
MVEDTVRMRAMRETMVLRLNTLRARDAGAPVGEVALPEFPESLPARAWLDTVSLGGRPMVRAGLDDVRAAEAAEALAGKDVWPDLQIGVQVAQRPGDAPGSTERMGSLMFGATIPVFARDRQFKARDEAAAMKQMALAELAAMRAETLGQIGEAYANLARARSLSSLYRTTVLPQAEATVASALAAYRVGTVDFLTLLDDRMTLSKYRQELFTLQADEGKAWAELEMLVGRELFNPNTSAATGTPARGGR